MLGLVVIATALLLDRHAYRTATIFMAMAICFKQTAIYFAPAFAMGLLRACIHRGIKRGSWLALQLFLISTLALCLILAPFLVEFTRHVLPLFNRVFPVARGLFEDKVANVWCAMAILTKFHLSRDRDTLFRWW